MKLWHGGEEKDAEVAVLKADNRKHCKAYARIFNLDICERISLPYASPYQSQDYLRFHYTSNIVAEEQAYIYIHRLI